MFHLPGVCLAGHIDRQKVYVAVNADKRRFPDNKQIIIIILLLWGIQKSTCLVFHLPVCVCFVSSLKAWEKRMTHLYWKRMTCGSEFLRLHSVGLGVSFVLFFWGGIAAYELISHPQHTCSSLRGHVTYTVKAGVFLVSVAILIGMCEAQYAIKILLKCVFVTLLNVSGNISHFDG